METFESILEYPPGSGDTCLPSSWWLDSEPGMDDRLIEAGTSLDDMIDDFTILPVNITDADVKETLFLARFEAVKFNGSYKHNDAIKDAPEGTILFVDFLIGMPYATVECAAVVGQLSSTPSAVSVVTSDSAGTVPYMPDDIFKGFEKGRVVYNVLWIDTKNGKDAATGEDAQPSDTFIANLEGTPLPERCHWWHRVYIVDKNNDLQWPVPGEFLSLCPRLFMTVPWGKQNGNPFMFSGNWIETVHYTNVKITEIIDCSYETQYPRYRIQYRKHAELIAKPTDFAGYVVGDKVTVIRVEKNKQSWTWNDLTTFNTHEWVIAPVSFYNDIANANK